MFYTLLKISPYNSCNCHFVLAVAREPFDLRCPSPVPLLRPLVHLAVGEDVLAVGGEVGGLEAGGHRVGDEGICQGTVPW